MSISVNSVTRVPPAASASTAPTPSTAPAVTAKSSSSTSTESDGVLQKQTPPRFPWLSRLTSELEPVAKQKPAFPAAPPLGDNLDQDA